MNIKSEFGVKTVLFESQMDVSDETKKDIFIPDFERPIRIPAKIKMEIVQPQIAIAGEKVTLGLKFYISKNIKTGEILKLQIAGRRNNRGFFKNLHEKLVNVHLENGTRLNIKCLNENCGTIVIVPPDKGFKRGEYLYAILKDIRCPEYRLLNKFFVLYKDDLKQPEGVLVWNNETQKKIVGVGLMHILGGDIHHIKVFAPSNIMPGKQFPLLIRPEDKLHNLSSEYLKDKDIEIFCGKTKIYGKFEKVDNSTCVRAYVKLKNQGVYRVRVRYRKNVAVSNPIFCERNKNKYKLYWGMIHGHTEMSDGMGTINNYFHQLKNEAGLDFGAPGDHDHLWETADWMWEKTCTVVKKWNEPGVFITFPGYEWAKWRRNGDGDRNVYYLKDNRPMYRSDEGCYPNPQALFRALKKEKVIVIPHHTAHGGNFCDWKDHDKKKERLIEIYQKRGSYECSEKDGNPVPECDKSGFQPFENGYVVNALLLGWRSGFTGGGDDHISHAGTDFPRGRCNYKDGLTGVFAKELTRKGIWEALWNRRTIATTGARIYLYYTVNNHPMGSEISFSKDENRRFHIIFQGTDILARIELIRNGKTVYVYRGENIDAEILWEDSTPIKNILLPPTKFSREPFVFYYIRAIQKNREVVWASPVWIISR